MFERLYKYIGKESRGTGLRRKTRKKGGDAWEAWNLNRERERASERERERESERARERENERTRERENERTREMEDKEYKEAWKGGTCGRKIRVW